MFRFLGVRGCVGEGLGQTTVEYALILAVVVAGLLLTVTWTGFASALQSAIAAVVAAL
jgi:hypothetical protein